MSNLRRAFHVKQQYLISRSGERLAAGPSRLVEQGRSAWQTWAVWDTARFGRVYLLDGILMAAESDAALAHASLVLPAALGQDSPLRALIVGGGDGGSLHVLSQCSHVQQIQLVELDPAVPDFARRHLQFLHCGSFDDPRLRLVHAEAFAWMAQAAKEGQRFGQIVYDLTDPGGLAARLYRRQGLMLCRQLLGEQGSLSLHLGNPLRQRARIRRLIAALRVSFAHVRLRQLMLPSHGGLWWLAEAGQRASAMPADAAGFDRRLAELAPALRYYNGALQQNQSLIPPGLCAGMF